LGACPPGLRGRQDTLAGTSVQALLVAWKRPPEILNLERNLMKLIF
jgi:hypothetical protein